MADGLIDSSRLAAFELGYTDRLLRGVHATMLDRDDPVEVDGLVSRLEQAAFVLLADHPVRHRAYVAQLRLASEHYGDQLDLIYEGETLAFEPGGPEPIWLLTRDALERLELLGLRALGRDEMLRAWHAVGTELASLALTALGGDGEPEGSPLIEATEKLPGRDGLNVLDSLPEVWDSPGQLARCLRQSYRSIKDYIVLTDSQRGGGGHSKDEERTATGEPSEGSNEGPKTSRKTPRTPCQADILCLLEKQTCRMSTFGVLAALRREGKHHGDSTIKTSLAEMVRAGLLTSCRDCRPGGYGLPAWGHGH